MAEYIWMWITAIFTAIVYVTAALILRGNLSLDGEPRWVWRKTRSTMPGHFESPETESEDEDEARHMANRLLWYVLTHIHCLS